MRPSRLEIEASVDKPSGEPLRLAVADDLRLEEENEDYSAEPEFGSIELLVTVPMHATISLHIEVGNTDLVTELDHPVFNDFAPSQLPVVMVSRDFVQGIIKFRPTCPAVVVDKAIHLVLDHWNQFSWHHMDLGYIMDVPYDNKYIDHSPCVCKSCKHNFSERNATIIESKSRPSIDLGVYKVAGPDVVDRAQLVVVCTNPKDPIHLKYCRVAHDVRCKNDMALLVPMPIATRPELYSFLTRFKYF